jgi:Barstar (barnase inhibitor)
MSEEDGERPKGRADIPRSRTGIDADMRVVDLDASGWVTALDFIRALQKALHAPAECGSNVDALNELMIWGLGMGELAPPYVVQISGIAKAPKEVQEHVALVASYVQKARKEKLARDGYDTDVGIKY